MARLRRYGVWGARRTTIAGAAEGPSSALAQYVNYILSVMLRGPPNKDIRSCCS